MKRILLEIQRQTGDNQTQLAKRFRITQPTVTRWLQGAEPKLKHHDRIMKVAMDLGIILENNGNEDAVEIVGYVGAGGQILFDDGQGPFGEAPMPPEGATRRTVAVTVRGDSMSGQLEDGWTVYYDNRQDPPSPALLGKLCVVGLTDGRVLIKRIVRQTSEGHYDLYSVNAPPLLDQAVAWAALVTWIHPG